MKKVFLIYTVLLVAIAITYFGFVKPGGSSSPKIKPQALAVSKHSKEFNESIQKIMDTYYGMTESFVNWDINAVNKNGTELKTAMDSVKLDELKKDTLIYETAVPILEDAKTEINGLISDTSLLEKRQSLNLLSSELLEFLTTTKYDLAKIYFDECPMAFDQGNPVANWLSATERIRNPYLGLHHPKYKGGMIECGQTKATINFMPADSTKK